jgi:hypothetical protein
LLTAEHDEAGEEERDQEPFTQDQPVLELRYAVARPRKNNISPRKTGG